MSRSLVRRVALSALLVAGACTDEPVEQLPAANPAGTAQRVDFDGRYIVTYKSQDGRAAAAFVGGQVALELPSRSAVAMRLSDAQANELRNRADIASVEPDVRRYPMAESVPYGVTMVQASQLAAGPGAPTVCIIDSGFSLGHEDLPSSNVTGSNDSGSGSWSEDTCGHGSHVAGTVAAVAGNGVGVVGVYPGVRLHIVKVFDGAACGWSYSSSLVAALDACRANGADVVSMSLGGTTKSTFEQQAFDAANAAGVLSVAAAGNDGNTRLSYPASYSSVMSVAAIDQNKVVATFSQHNAQVDIAAPGVGVTSTYIFEASLSVGGNTYQGSPIEFAAMGTATGALADGGLCDSVGSWSGKVVLCQRGVISFAEKVTNAQNGGASGVAIYNNVAGGFSGTLGTGGSSTIPAISLSMEDGTAALASVGQSTTLVSDHGDGYADLSGTSMATPHVSAVAALLWSHFPGATNQEIRDALIATAQDLGAAGRDDYYGAGLVQVRAAYDLLNGGGGGGPDCSADGVCNPDCTDDPDCGQVCLPKGDSCTAGSQCCSGACRGKGGNKTCR